MVQGVFRNLSLLDYFISRSSERPFEKIDPIILWILRLSLYQIEFMRIPDYASVHEAGLLCKRFRKTSAHSFVNGVLRSFLREKPVLPEGTSAKVLAVRYSHPEWLVQRYLHRYGPQVTQTILGRNNETPDSVLWVNRFKTNFTDFLKHLDREDIPYEVLVDPPDAVKIDAKAFSEHRLYLEGYCFFMDVSSQRIAHLSDLSRSRFIADFCAAPGGKTFVMAGRARPGALILCSDIDSFRLHQTRERAERYGIKNLLFAQMDLSRPAACTCCFDSVLLDVPCSGTGTLRSNPEIRWRIDEEVLAALHDKQIELLRNAFSALLPGRELLYSTCSTEPEENEDVIDEFLLVEKRSELIGEYFRTFPAPGEGEGFFAARIRRV